MSDAADCPRWCDFHGNGPHNGRHVHHLGELLLSEASPSHVLAVTVEGQDDQPLPVVTIGGKYNFAYGAALLSWEQADQLTGMLTDARQRYA